MTKTTQSLALTEELSGFDKREQGHGGWQKVRLMPALLRIFTRVNLLVMVGEKQGIESVDNSPRTRD